MKKALAALIATVALVLPTIAIASPAHAATPVPGRFCGSADHGRVVNTAKYGKVKCKQDSPGSRYWRWVQL